MDVSVSSKVIYVTCTYVDDDFRPRLVRLILIFDTRQQEEERETNIIWLSSIDTSRRVVHVHSFLLPPYGTNK